MSKVVQIKPYLKDLKYLIGIDCTIYEKYHLDGISAIYNKVDESISVKFYTFNGSEIRLDEDGPYNSLIKKITTEILNRIIVVAKSIKLSYAQFVFNDQMLLIDVILKPDKYLSPGMLKDTFGKLVKTPKEIATSNIDQNTKFKDVIIKPNKFRTHVVNNSFLPLYVEL